MMMKHRKGLLMYVLLTAPSAYDDHKAICIAQFKRWAMYSERKYYIYSDSRYKCLLEAADEIKPAEDEFGMELVAKCWNDEFKPQTTTYDEEMIRIHAEEAEINEREMWGPEGRPQGTWL